MGKNISADKRTMGNLADLEDDGDTSASSLRNMAKELAQADEMLVGAAVFLLAIFIYRML